MPGLAVNTKETDRVGREAEWKGGRSLAMGDHCSAELWSRGCQMFLRSVVSGLPDVSSFLKEAGNVDTYEGDPNI